jgi:hypothetical protein
MKRRKMAESHVNLLAAAACLAIGAAVLAAGQPARAQSVPVLGVDPAVTYTFNESYYGASIGWTFKLTQPMTVTGVGWYDEGGDGLSHSHEIGLWSGEPTFEDPSNVVQLFTATVPAGTTAPLDGPWRRLDFNVSLTLEPGIYEIAGTDYSENRDVVKFIEAADLMASNLFPDPRLRVWEPAFTPPVTGQNPTLYPPIPYLQQGVELGAMLFVEPVPEPSIPALGALGAAVLLACQRRGGTRRATRPAAGVNRPQDRA